MSQLIVPRQLFTDLKNGTKPPILSPNDVLVVEELGQEVLFSLAMDASDFYHFLKKGVAGYNSQAFLSNGDLLDFDDLYTKYEEYLEVLSLFLAN